ncbi:hypothetical protein THAOC_27263, partial [Thalassiosira oceanica]
AAVRDALSAADRRRPAAVRDALDAADRARKIETTLFETPSPRPMKPPHIERRYRCGSAANLASRIGLI